DLGDKQQALKFYNQALTLSREVEDKSGEATTLNNIGGVYDLLGDKQQALKLYKQSLLLRRKVEDKSGEAGSLNDIGSVYQELGDIPQALKYYNQALLLSREVGDKTQQATTLNNIGYAYSDLGDKQQALKYYNQALFLSREVGDKTQQSTTLNNIGTVYSDLGDKQRALNFFNQALLLSREVEYKFVEAKALNNIGAVYDNLGEKQQALKFYNQALPLEQKIGDKSGEAITLNNIGFVYFNLRNNEEALKHYNQSLPLAQEVGDKDGEATTLTNIGKVYNLLGDNQRALKFHNQALPLAREIGYKQREATILRDIAGAYRKNGDLKQALTNSKAAVDIIENLRTKVDSNELRTSYFATVQDIYKLHIDILMQLHLSNPSLGYDAQALAASEKSRARGLLELLTEARADIRKGANPQLLAEESRLQQLISAKEKLRLSIVNDKNKSNDLISKNAAQKLKKQIKNHLNEYKQLQVQIKQSNPKYANIKYPEPLKLPQIQQQLDKDSLLLQYSLGDDRSYLWLVSSNSLDVYELPKKSEIEKASINLFCLISQNSSKPPDATGKENPCENTENIKTRRIDLAAEELSKLALAPVKDKLGKKRLIVVADGALQYIPFAALADLNSQSASSRKSGKPQTARDSKSSAVATTRRHLLQRREPPQRSALGTRATRRRSLSNSKSPLKKTGDLLINNNAANPPSSVRFNGLQLLAWGLQPQVGGMLTQDSKSLLSGILIQDSQPQVGGMLTQDSKSQVGGMLTQNSQPLADEISHKYSKQNQKDSSCTNTGGISVCQDENSPQNKFNYQPLLVNHEMMESKRLSPTSTLLQNGT
ncbi:MAG: tetratricopeptide repeat protein, partial [Rivularia sp. (in: cyanobacteria)]